MIKKVEDFALADGEKNGQLLISIEIVRIYLHVTCCVII
ncbi:unnamed protein product [Brassica oleracea var. botrytis]|uniref:(rape) hypothetical protein n=1 Tax=Brassica napus TaxID=3708 RepID=A0A816J941_BRANA|nr:unnamed protein product [Brassica napus]